MKERQKLLNGILTSAFGAGKIGKPGDSSENGSPRVKQRAFYDYLRDVFANIFRIPVISV